MMKHNKFNIKENAIWALTNLMSSAPAYIQQMLEFGLLDVLDDVCNEDSVKLGVLRISAFCLSNLMRFAKKEKELIRRGVDLLSNIIFTTDLECVTDACYGYRYLTDTYGFDEELDNYIFTNMAESLIIPKLIDIMSKDNVATGPAIRTLGNISASNVKMCDEQIIKNDWYNQGEF